MPKNRIYNLRLEEATLDELEKVAKSSDVPVSQVLREMIDRELGSLALRSEAESLTLEQMNLARLRLDRMIADAEEHLIAEIRAKQVAPDLVKVELRKGVWIRIDRAEAVEKGLKFQELKSSK